MHRTQSLVGGVTIAFVTLVAVSAQAQYPGEYDRPPTYDRSSERDAHEEGYRAGYEAGQDDARRGQASDYARHDAWRRGSVGVGIRIGRLSIELFQTQFRRGFGDGYRAGYGARYAVPRGDGRYDRPYGAPLPNAYPGSPYDDAYGRYGARSSPAYERGMRDGYRRGVDDGRDADRYDAYGHRDYRRADNGYERWYGSRDGYQDQYRAGFLAGYDRGYRESRPYANDGRRGWGRW